MKKTMITHNQLSDKEALSLTTYHILFSRNCNLRCSYCSTGYGTYLSRKGQLKDSLWQYLVNFAFSHSPKKAELRFELGVGESTLYFPQLLRFIDYVQACARTSKKIAQFHITTNGTILKHEELKELARRSISLTFSIDGPAEAHDTYRKDSRRRSTHQRAFENWSRYRELSLHNPERPSCSVLSVYTGIISLSELASFWLRNGQRIFTIKVRMPSRYTNTNFNSSAWNRLQNRYLKELSQWAMERAKKLLVPSFLSEYHGPQDIYNMWQKLFLNDSPTSICGIGTKNIAVDDRGVLYPCEAFLDSDAHNIGTLTTGINIDRLHHFFLECKRASNRCIGCKYEYLCEKPCFARLPEKSFVENYIEGCSFGAKLAHIGLSSYQKLLKLKNRSSEYSVLSG